MNKKRIFGIVVVIVIIYFTYRYMKGLQQTASNTENSESNSERIDPNANLPVEANESTEMMLLRQMALAAYGDLKGPGNIHPEPFRPIVQLTNLQFKKFLEIYKEYWTKGFKHHINNQGAAWTYTSEKRELKEKLDVLIYRAEIT